MTPVEALELALSKENQSVELYQKLSVENPAIKELLAFLINEEEGHKKMIEEKIRELNQ